MINANVLQGRYEISKGFYFIFNFKDEEQFLQLMATHKMEKDRMDYEEAINAFVAMGGQEDGSGEILTEKLI